MSDGVVEPYAERYFNAARTLERIGVFLLDKTDDISIGVRRIMFPLRTCGDCGQVVDMGMGTAGLCPCWSPVTQRDIDELHVDGLDIEEREPDEGSPQC